jgi:TRAP-type C4-dicarboxylate transport system substrate-binding protein
MRYRLAIVAALVAALGATGCQAAASDKTGGKVVVLRLATIDSINDNGQSPGPQAFVDGLAKVSGGRLKTQVSTDYEQGAPQAETDIVKAIASGALDGGWPATRAFENAGLPGLRAVEAPMTITSYAAEKAVASGPVAAKLLSTLDGSGVMGLGFAVGPLRRPFAAKSPLLGTADWAGARFRVYNSPVQAEAVKALGGTPIAAQFDWLDQIHDGILRGGEADIAGWAYLGFEPTAGTFTGNVVLWPKMYVLSLSRKRFAALTHQQQGWVREAAEQAVKTSVAATYDDQTPATQLCAKGMAFPSASADQLAGLKKALEPTVAALAADATSGPLLHEIQAVATQHQPDIVQTGTGCQGQSSGEALGPIPTTRSTFPDGVYRVQISQADVIKSGLGRSQGLPGTWTLTVHSGAYQLTCRANVDPRTECGQGPVDVPLEVGDLRGTGQTAYFVFNKERMSQLTGCQLPPSRTKPGHCWDQFVYRMNWALSGDKLTFNGFVSAGGGDDEWLVKPWTKIS